MSFPRIHRTYLLWPTEYMSLWPGDSQLQNPTLFLLEEKRRENLSEEKRKISFLEKKTFYSLQSNFVCNTKRSLIYRDDHDKCTQQWGMDQLHWITVYWPPVGVFACKVWVVIIGYMLSFDLPLNSLILIDIIEDRSSVLNLTSAIMSPFSAWTWAIAPRSRITLNTS